MAITDILLRFTAYPPLTTKGSELTFVEGDANLIEIYEYLQSLATASGVAPYNAGTTYTGTQYVTYGGNLWQHVTASSTGVTPGTNPAVWSLTSIGAISHVQNTDTALATGTANQVTASELKSLLNDGFKTGTRAAIISLRNSNGLKPGYFYYLSDKRIALQATSVGALSSTGFYLAYNPDWTDASGQMLTALGSPIWGAPTSAWWVNVLASYPTAGSRIGKFTIYKGSHYVSLTGANTATTPDSDAINWALAAVGHASYRRAVELVTYDLDNDSINQRIDGQNNRVARFDGETTPLEERFQFGNPKVINNECLGRVEIFDQRGEFSHNFSDASSRVFATDTDPVSFIKLCSFINSEVFLDGNKSGISRNSFTNCVSHDMTGQLTGLFTNNTFTNCFYSSFSNNEGIINQCSFDWLYSETFLGTLGTDLDLCHFSGALYFDPGVPLSGLYIVPGFSNQAKAITITDATSAMYLVFRTEAMVTITGTGTATLTDIYLEDTQKGKVVKIMPDVGYTLNLDCGTSNIRNVANTLTTLSLDGSLGHYVLGVWLDSCFEIIKENV